MNIIKDSQFKFLKSGIVLILILNLLLISNSLSSYSSSHSTIEEHPLTITEINFRGDEYIEILSNSTHNPFFSFNESYFKTINEKGINEFSLFSQHPNSSIILIVGENFITNNDAEFLENLQCTIYQTNRAQVGFRSLRNGGENITIQFSNTINVSYSPTQVIEYTNEEETLHFNSTHSFVSQRNPCELDSSFQQEFNTLLNISTSTDDSNENIGNQTENKTENNQTIIDEKEDEENNSSSCELTLEVNEIIEDTRIQFTFRGNISYGVTYYVEDGVGNVVRNPFTSNTASPKSYTPRKNGKFIIFGYIDDENCGKKIEVNATTFFYNSHLDIDVDSSSSGSSSSVPRVQQNTFLQINQVVQEGFNQVRLVGEVSRGNSNAYRFSINVNGKRVSEFDVKRYGHFDFQIPLQLEAGENIIEIQGFGLRDSVRVVMPDITTDLEDTIILLMHKHGLTSNSIESSNIETPSLSSIELQEPPRQSSTSLTNLEVNSSQIIVNETSSSNSNELLFSKHFFHQNIGIISIVGGLVLVAGVIIAMR